MLSVTQAIRVLVECFGCQVAGSRYLSEQGLLIRDVTGSDWDILVPRDYISLVEDFLKRSGLFGQRNQTMKTPSQEGEYTVLQNYFGQSDEVIELYIVPNGYVLNVADALASKVEYASGKKNVTKSNQAKHRDDLSVCYEELVKRCS